MQFGLYLVEKGVIGAKQFVTALRQQVQEHVPLGQLAVEKGILTNRQVFEILRAQSDTPPDQFGKSAVGQGKLSEQKLAELLWEQSQRQRPLAEILVEQGALTEDSYREELSAFRRERERK